jgi:hypothetical protein
VASRRGFEPPTCPLGGGCAIQLCHRDVIESLSLNDSLQNSKALQMTARLSPRIFHSCHSESSEGSRHCHPEHSEGSRHEIATLRSQRKRIATPMTLARNDNYLLFENRWIKPGKPHQPIKPSTAIISPTMIRKIRPKPIKPANTSKLPMIIRWFLSALARLQVILNI